MSSVIYNKTYLQPPFSKSEILRYAGCKTADTQINELLEWALKEVEGKLSYKVCYRELCVTVSGNNCDFGLFSLKSQNLALNLKDVSSVVLFAATIGIELDRLVAKYGHISPSRAVMLQAVGAERIEALCDMFCSALAKEKGAVLKPRFSAGYGDLSLEAQRDIFRFLDCPRQIGLSLSDSLLMSPSKSVTAFVGLV